MISLTLLLGSEKLDGETRRVHLVAVGPQVGPVGLAARFILGTRFDRAVIDTEGFDFASVDRIDHPMFLPGILRYGGMSALWELNRSLATGRIKGRNAIVSAVAAARRQ